MLNFFARTIPWLLVLILSVGLGYALFGGKDEIIDPEKEPGSTVFTHHMLVDKIESLGKLELSKFYLKDIVEHKEVKEWYRDNNDIVLIISGEVIGCIDLTKIDSAAVQLNTDTITVTLPAPEICSFKINHQQSKVYYINTSVWDNLQDDAALIDRAYKHAEAELSKSAQKMDLLGQTKRNAQLILKPILEQMTGKTVVLK